MRFYNRTRQDGVCQAMGDIEEDAETQKLGKIADGTTSRTPKARSDLQEGGNSEMQETTKGPRLSFSPAFLIRPFPVPSTGTPASR